MGILIEKENGWTEAILDSNCGYDKFFAAAEIMQKDLQINFMSKLDDFDSLYWDFFFEECHLTLYYNIYLGVSIFPKAFKSASPEDNNKVIELGVLLFGKLQGKTG
jgi:hypothetical protein